jgi:pectate lyase
MYNHIDNNHTFIHAETHFLTSSAIESITCCKVMDRKKKVMSITIAYSKVIASTTTLNCGPFDLGSTPMARRFGCTISHNNYSNKSCLG